MGASLHRRPVRARRACIPSGSILFALAGAVLLAPLPAWAKSSRCFTTDDGYFACRFKATDRLGSFEISAPDKPTYTINVGEPGFAYGFLNLGNRNVALPGQFVRQSDDPACWSNPETSVKICAW